MNSLKQNLDNALDSLELTPAMEAEILMNASAPARKTRHRSRAVIAALLVMCLLSITAISAFMGSGWQIRKEGKELVATPDQPTHAQLSKKAMKLIEKCIETKERRMGYDDVEQFTDAFGYKLLKIDPLQLEPFDDVQKNVRVNVGGLHAESAQITARYHGRMFGESGKQTAHVSIHTCLDMDVDPHDITHTFAFESEDGDESVGQHPVFSTYYLTSLGVTAEIMSWPEDVFMGIEAFFIHKNVTYHVSIHVPTNVLSTHESMLADCHAILDMMHE